ERAAELDTLRASVGADARTVLERLDALRDERQQLEQQQRDARESFDDANQARARFEGEAKGIRDRLPDAEEQLGTAERALDASTPPALMEMLGVSEEPLPSPARLAQAVADAPVTDEWLRTTEPRLWARLE